MFKCLSVICLKRNTIHDKFLYKEKVQKGRQSKRLLVYNATEDNRGNILFFKLLINSTVTWELNIHKTL